MCSKTADLERLFVKTVLKNGSFLHLVNLFEIKNLGQRKIERTFLKIVAQSFYGKKGIRNANLTRFVAMEADLLVLQLLGVKWCATGGWGIVAAKQRAASRTWLQYSTFLFCVLRIQELACWGLFAFFSNWH